MLAPWWVSALLAFLAYVLLPRIFPPAIAKGGLVAVITFVLIALSAISALRSLKNRRMLDGQTGLDSLRGISWKQFEDLVAEAFRRRGYKVEEMLGGGADGGIDLRLRKDGRLTLVQCKRWRDKPVPVEIVREVFGLMVHENASGAKIVATTAFTPDAIAFAQGKSIELVDSNSLLQLVRDVQRTPRVSLAVEDPDHVTPACPKCGATMILREARRGANAGRKFWGCPAFPKCRGTREL